MLTNNELLRFVIIHLMKKKTKKKNNKLKTFKCKMYTHIYI